MGLHHATFERLRLSVYICCVRRCADSTCHFYLAVSGRLAGGDAERGAGAARLGSCSGGGLAWKDMLLLLALAGPAGDLKNALLRRCLGCHVADCVSVSDRCREREKNHSPSCPPSPFSSSSPLAPPCPSLFPSPSPSPSLPGIKPASTAERPTTLTNKRNTLRMSAAEKKVSRASALSRIWAESGQNLGRIWAESGQNQR